MIPKWRSLMPGSVMSGFFKTVFTISAVSKARTSGLAGVTHAEMDSQRQQWMANTSLTPEENGYPCPPEAEPYDIFKTRTMETLTRHLSDTEGGSVLFVAHGGVYRVLRRCLFSELDHSANAQPFYFEKVEKGLWKLTEIA